MLRKLIVGWALGINLVLFLIMLFVCAVVSRLLVRPISKQRYQAIELYLQYAILSLFAVVTEWIYYFKDVEEPIVIPSDENEDGNNGVSNLARLHDDCIISGLAVFRTKSTKITRDSTTFGKILRGDVRR